MKALLNKARSYVVTCLTFFTEIFFNRKDPRFQANKTIVFLINLYFLKSFDQLLSEITSTFISIKDYSDCIISGLIPIENQYLNKNIMNDYEWCHDVTSADKELSIKL